MRQREVFKNVDDCVKKIGEQFGRQVNWFGRNEKDQEYYIALSLRDELLLAEMNMWYGVKQLGERWNGFPCFGQSLFAKTPFGFYQQPQTIYIISWKLIFKLTELQADKKKKPLKDLIGLVSIISGMFPQLQENRERCRHLEFFWPSKEL